MKEIWKDVIGYEGLYQVSNKGRVKGLQRLKWNGKTYCIIKEKIRKNVEFKGYRALILYKNAKQKRYLLHRIVAQAFIPNPKNKPQINHINGIKNDNRVSNLEWVSQLENNRHAWSIGLSTRNTYTKEMRNKMSNSAKGKIISEQTKKKMSKRCSGSGNPKARKTIFKKYNDIYEFGTIKEACKIIGVSKYILLKHIKSGIWPLKDYYYIKESE